MRKLIFLFVLLSFSSAFGQINNDKLIAPAEGKSVIYFMRTSGLGALMNFRYFDESNYLGKFNGVNYLRYECEPGKHLFWILAENTDVLEANLAANKIYIVETNATMGAFSAAARFKLVDYKNNSQIKRINKLLNKKDAKQFTEEELKKAKDKMFSAYSKRYEKSCQQNQKR